MEEKQKRAELKRQLNLQAVRRKAQEEEAKVLTLYPMLRMDILC